MAKTKKKRAYSTKDFMKKPDDDLIQNPIMPPAPEENAEADPAPRPAQLPTIDDAIEEFRKNPRKETFFSPGLELGIAHGDTYIKFKWDQRRYAGVYVTDNPKEVEIIMRAVDPGIRYNVAVFADNPALRNIRIK